MSISNMNILAEVKIWFLTFFLTHLPTPPWPKKADFRPLKAENQKTKVTLAIWTHHNEEIGWSENLIFDSFLNYDTGIVVKGGGWIRGFQSKFLNSVLKDSPLFCD